MSETIRETMELDAEQVLRMLTRIAEAAERSFRGAADDAKKAEKAVEGVGDAAQDSGKDFLAMASQIGSAATGVKSFVDMLGGAISGMKDFAASGAGANDVQKNFNRLGASMKDFQAAVAGTIDGTSLQTQALIAMSEDGLSMTAQQFEDVAKLAAYTADKYGTDILPVLQKLVKGKGLDEYGIRIDNIKEKLGKMSKAQQNAAIAAELAAQGAKVNVGALKSESLAIAAAQAKVDDFESTLQQWTATTLVSSGAIEGFEDMMGMLNEVFAENQEETQALIQDGVKVLLLVLPPLLETLAQMADAWSAVTATIDPLLSVFEALEPYLKKAMNFLGGIGDEIDDLTSTIPGVTDLLSWFSEGSGGGEMVDITAQMRDRLYEQAEAHKAAGRAAAAHASVLEDIRSAAVGGEGDMSMTRSLQEAAERRRKLIEEGAGGSIVDFIARKKEAGGSRGGGTANDDQEGLDLGGWLGESGGASARSRLARQSLLGMVTGAGREEEQESVAQWGDTFTSTLDRVKDSIGETRDAAGEWWAEYKNEAERVKTINEQLSDSVVRSLGGAFQQTFTAVITSSGSFRQKMFGIIGGLISQLGGAFVAWAAAEVALLSGNPYAAAAVAATMGIAGAAISAYGGRSSGSSTGSSAGVTRAIERQMDQKETTPTIMEVNLHGIPVPDKTARELHMAIQRSMELEGAAA